MVGHSPKDKLILKEGGEEIWCYEHYIGKWMKRGSGVEASVASRNRGATGDGAGTGGLCRDSAVMGRGFADEAVVVVKLGVYDLN